MRRGRTDSGISVLPSISKSKCNPFRFLIELCLFNKIYVPVGCILAYKKWVLPHCFDEITSLFRFLSIIYSYILKRVGGRTEDIGCLNFLLTKTGSACKNISKDSLSFKEIARRMDKNPTTISREVRNYSSLIATGYPGFPYNACKNRFDCRKKKSVEKSVHGNQISTVSSVNPAIPTVQTFWKKSAWRDFGCPMSVMAVKALISVHF